MTEQSCYACSLPPMSREHVPPKSLFPELRDIPEKDLRQHLITVPSCEHHNLAKSQDDEFLMVCLAGLVGGNSIGYRHNAGKVDRAVRRSANRLLNKVVANPRRIRFEVADNRFIDVLWGTPDAARLSRCFESIVRGLLYHDFGTVFDGKIHVHLSFLHYEVGNARSMKEFLRRRIALDVDQRPKLGANPEVFYYQRSEPDEFGLLSYRLRFYSAIEVLAGVWPASSNPPHNLIQNLIAGGVRTRLTLGSETFDFN